MDRGLSFLPKHSRADAQDRADGALLRIHDTAETDGAGAIAAR